MKSKYIFKPDNIKNFFRGAGKNQRKHWKKRRRPASETQGNARKKQSEIWKQ